MTRLSRWLFRVQYPYAEAVDSQRARGLLAVCVVLMITALVTSAYTILTLTTPVTVSSLSAIAVSIVTLAASLVSIGLLQNGKLRQASFLFVSVFTVSLLIGLIPFGVNTVIILVLTLPLTLAGVLFGRQGIVVESFVISVAVIVLGVGAMASYTSATPATLNRVTFNTIFIVLLFLLSDAGILWVFSGGLTDLIGRLSQAVRELRTVTSVSQAMNNKFSVDDLLVESVQTVHDQFGYHLVQVYLAEPGSRLIVRRATSGGRRPDNVDRRIPLNDPKNVVALAVRTGAAQKIDLSTPLSNRTEFSPATQSEMLIPLRRADQILGVLDVHRASAEPFSEYDIDVMEAVAAQLAIALQNIQRYNELQDSSAERKRLQDQNTRLSRDVERLNQEVSGLAWNRFMASRPENMIGFDWQDGQAQPNVELTPTLASAAQNALPEAFTEGEQQVMTVPILLRGQLLGVMEFRAPGESPWDNRSLELTRIISQRLSLSLENIRLFEQAQITASREQTIGQVAARLQARSDLESLLSVAAEAFSDALGAAHTSIQLKVPDDLVMQEEDR